ncbi:dynamin family protein [Sulfurospirillum sp. 1307]
MYIINDFFLLIWQEGSKCRFSSYGDIKNYLGIVLEKNFELFCDYVAILLIVSNENINSLKDIKEARDALNYLSGLNEWDKKRIQFTQKEVLFFLTQVGNVKLNKAIEKRFDKLRKESIIGYEKTRKLISLLALIKEKKNQIKPLHVEKAKEGENFYESSINLICSSIANLKKAIEDTNSLSRLEVIPQKLKEQKFSIGVTGVMNAGKSTMLNALLGKEILGTSVIPETANLTVIKYAKEPSAVVNFWKQNEWKKIEESASYLENLKPFVDETKKIFFKNLGEFITQDGLSKKIDINELPSYTSAEHSDKKCNLVKSVELYTDLKFVENGVEIVDTPGLDDPVIQREEITKNYLLECDLMIHLMNVNQSATQKDVEFIIDSLLYQNVARLLIVITRIDTVSSEELNEVIEYTKNSIKNKLISLNKENSFDAILNKIDFIPIAGYMALLHRIGRKDEALKAGYDLQSSGILKVENYLEEVLFGKDSQKAKVIIDANKKEIINIIKFNKTSFLNEKELLSKSSSEIANEYKKYQSEISGIKDKLEKLNSLIDEETNELKGYFSTLKRFAQSKINSLKDIAKRRVCDDFSYEVRKNKTKPKEERIAYIIETALKDGFIDLTRDYRYQFSKKIEESFEKISREFEEFSQIDKNSMTDSKEFFNKHFSDINFTNSNVLLIQKVNTAIRTASKKDIDSLCEKVDVYFEEAMKNIYEEFNKKVEHINDDLVLEFTKSAKLPMQNMQESMQKQEEILNLAKQRIEDKSFDTSKRVSECEQKLKLLDIVLKDLEDL